MDINEMSVTDGQALCRILLKGIRSRNLSNFVTLSYCLIHSEESAIHKTVASRLYKKGLPVTHTNLAYELKPEEVMAFLDCSKRTAYDYIRALQSMNL